MLTGRPKNPKHARNKNVLIVGGSGSGKTRFWLKPNLMNLHSSYCITDPKGQILVECGHLLRRGAPKMRVKKGKDGKPLKDRNGNDVMEVVKNKQGEIVREPYEIKVLNTIDFKKSMHYNPFVYSKDLSNKVKSAKRVQMKRGENIVKRAIYGYRKCTLPGSPNYGKWEPDGVAAAVVRKIFDLALEGHSTAQIRDIVAGEQHETPSQYLSKLHNLNIRQSDTWSARMVLAVLNNEQYTGTYIAGKEESKAVGSHSKNHLDRSEWIVIPDNHTPIVSKEEFARVQELLKKYPMYGATKKPMDYAIRDEASRPNRERMLRGEYNAAPIYGYRKTENGEWLIDEPTAAVVRAMFELARQGLNAYEIAESLKAAEYMIPRDFMMICRGHRVTPSYNWTTKSVRAILKDVKYTGAYVAGKILMNYETGKRYHVPESDWIVIPDMRPAIVSKELFDEAQAVIANGRIRRKNARPLDYLLRGKVVCGCCGYALVYDPSGVKTFRCWHTHGDPNAECHKLKVNAQQLDGAILTIIRKQAEVVLNCGDLTKLRRKGEAEKQTSDYESLIRQCNERQQQYYERFVLREIDRDEFIKLKGECGAEIDRLNRQIAILRADAQSGKARQKAIAAAKQAVDETVPHKELVDALIDKVRVYPGDRVEVEWRIADFAAVS